MRRILLINGPNLGLLGLREPKIYGTTTLHEIEQSLKVFVKESKYSLQNFQSDTEGELISYLGKEFISHSESCEKNDTRIAGVIINPGGYSHTSIALRDALSCYASAGILVIEVHLSNIHAREEFRSNTLTGAVCTGIISGLGAKGYQLAARFIMERTP